MDSGCHFHFHFQLGAYWYTHSFDVYVALVSVLFPVFSVTVANVLRMQLFLRDSPNLA